MEKAKPKTMLFVSLQKIFAGENKYFNCYIFLLNIFLLINYFFNYFSLGCAIKIVIF